MTQPAKFSTAIAQAAAASNMGRATNYTAPKAKPATRIRYHPLNGNREEAAFLRSIDYEGNEGVVGAYLRGISCAEGFLPHWATFERRTSMFNRPADWRPARVFMSA